MAPSAHYEALAALDTLFRAPKHCVIWACRTRRAEARALRHVLEYADPRSERENPEVEDIEIAEPESDVAEDNLPENNVPETSVPEANVPETTFS